MEILSNDLLIKNGKIIDGAGNPWYYGEIAVKDGKIARIRVKINEEAKTVIDASDLIVSPGFIDIHSHTDYILPISSKQESTLWQGIITAVVGMCGDGMAPIPPEKEREFKETLAVMNPIFLQMDFPYNTFTEYLDYIDKLRNSANLVFMVGYGNLRFAGGQGGENRPANQEELNKMKEYLREAMEAGTFGMSTGLIYAPKCLL